jgi:hypothetical protein
VIALYAGAAALVAGVVLGWTVRDWKAGAEEARTARAASLELEGRDRRIHAASSQYQAQLASAQARERIVIQEVERVASKPEYRDQCLDDDGMRILADDIQSSNTRRGLGPAVPAASAPGR